MADDNKGKQQQSAEAPAKKRVVKNPETFRERALKAGQEADKPSRSSKFKQASGRLTNPVTKPVGKAASKAGTFKPLRILGYILLPKYFRQSWVELRQVTWPGWRESRKLTYAVLVFAVIFAAIVALLDFLLDKLFQDILLK